MLRLDCGVCRTYQSSVHKLSSFPSSYGIAAAKNRAVIVMDDSFLAAVVTVVHQCQRRIRDKLQTSPNG
jgi:hypothetical protein